MGPQERHSLAGGVVRPAAITASTWRRKPVTAIARNPAPISDSICASGRPVLRATTQATGRAATLVHPVRPTWPIATKFHFGILRRSFLISRAGLRVHPPGDGHWHLPDAALCSALAEFLTWVTAGTTVVTAVAAGWPFADVIAVCRPDSEVLSAAVCDGYADFASVTNADALVWTLVSAVCKELRPFLATSTLPRSWTEVLSWSASVQ